MDGGVTDICFVIAFCLVQILQQLHSFFNMPFGSMLVPWQTLGYCRGNRLTHVMLITESNNLVIDLTKWMLPKECSSFFLLKCWPLHPWIGDGQPWSRNIFSTLCWQANWHSAQSINSYICNYIDEASVKKAKYFN